MGVLFLESLSFRSYYCLPSSIHWLLFLEITIVKIISIQVFKIVSRFYWKNFIISYNPCNLQLCSIQTPWVSQSRWCCIKFIRHVFIKWGIKVCIRKIMHQLVFEYNYEDQCQKENLSKSFNDVTDGGLVLLIFFSHLVMVSSPCII